MVEASQVTDIETIRKTITQWLKERGWKEGRHYNDPLGYYNCKYYVIEHHGIGVGGGIVYVFYESTGVRIKIMTGQSLQHKPQLIEYQDPKLLDTLEQIDCQYKN